MSRQPARPAALPPVTLFKLEQAAFLLERVADENTTLFAQKAASYTSDHREASARRLSAIEAAQIAAALAERYADEDAAAVAERIQASGLRAHDEPSRSEVLLRAGVATAPAFLDAIKRLVALIELDSDALEAAAEAGTLDDVLDEKAVAMGRLPLKEAKARAVRAMEHFAEEAGDDPKALMRLVARTIGEALSQATSGLGSPLASLSGSLDEPDGLGETSSTTSATATPA